MGSFERYRRNTSAFSEEEVLRLHQKKVAIVGCGGLGGHVIQGLARFGILSLTLIDGDVFAVSNLNRQLFATEKTLGENKALTAKEQLADINPDVSATALPAMMTAQNAEEFLTGHDLVMDCLDNRDARLLLDDTCRKLSIPYVHGAIGGFYGQVTSVFPGDSIVKMLYGGGGGGIEQELGNPSFIPQAVAAIQCSEALKILVGRGEILRGKLLSIDLLRNEFDVTTFC